MSTQNAREITSKLDEQMLTKDPKLWKHITLKHTQKLIEISGTSKIKFKKIV